VQIFDYADIHVPVLDRMYAKRMKGYSSIGYKTKSDVKLPDAGNIIFDSASFLPVFTADLLSAKHEVIVVSPYATSKRTANMMEILMPPIASGVKVTVVTRPPGEYREADRLRVSQIIKMLRDQNIAVIERSKIHQKFAVLDNRIAWYGSINLLSYGSAEESVMRLESKGIAGELLRIIASSSH
jgi:phosphatidylserine/phosphatidylglycerophosphate/cardiolipin synthase-like enzyme